MTRTLLVTVDSLRYDHFEYMPATRSFLDVEHDRAFSTFPETFGSFPAIIGGRYATERGLQSGTSVANQLYGKNVGITTNHLLSPAYNYDEGFDHFNSPEAGGEGIAAKVSDRIELGGTVYNILSWAWNQSERVISRVSRIDKSFRRADEVIDEFFEEVKREDDWFGWLHFMEPHHPYDPYSSPIPRDRANRLSRDAVAGRVDPDSERGEMVRELYRREVAELDIELRRLWQKVPDDTTVVFTGDHGELLGEDNTWGHPGLLHPLLHHVPFGGRNLDTDLGGVVSLIDIPTLLRGEEYELGQKSRETAFALYGDRRAAMNRERITTWELNKGYDTRNLLDESADQDSELKKAIDEFGIHNGITRYEADEETLKKLGYLE